MKDQEHRYQQYADHARHNELEILSSKECGCLACGKTFSARLVKSWFTDEDGLSASCPHCGLAYVVGDGSGLAVDPEEFHRFSFWKKLHRHDDEEDDLMEFCAAYYDGKIEQTAELESIYLNYLSILSEEYGIPMATHALARFYHFGSPFHEPDYDKAIHYLSLKPLCFDSNSLFEIGNAYDSRDGKGDARRAFEAYAKAASLGSISASIRIADYYLRGRYVKKDVEFGLTCLMSAFGEMFLKAFTSAQSLPELAVCAYDIGLCFHSGVGCEKAPFRSLRYFLLAQFFVGQMMENDMPSPYWIDEAKKEIDELAYEGKLDAASKEVVFDDDTFFDTYLEQYDSVCLKTIESIEMVDDAVVMRMTSVSPQIIIDVGNLAVDKFTDTTWRFANARYALLDEDKVPLNFQRIEVDSHYAASFIREDPVYGDIVVLRIEFPEQEEADKGNS